MSRATLWRATSSNPGSSVVRITDCSSLSGLASGSTRPRGRVLVEAQAAHRLGRS